VSTIRALLKSYAIAGLCFALLGAPLVSTWMSITISAADHWKVRDALPVLASLVFWIIGMMTWGFYGALVFGGPPMAVAGLAFVACASLAPRTIRTSATTAITGAAIGLVAGIVSRVDALVATPLVTPTNRPPRLSMVFADERASGTATETLDYESRHGKPVLTLYRYVFEGPRNTPAYAALVVAR